MTKSLALLMNVFVLGLSLFAQPFGAPAKPLSASDTAAIKAVVEKYRTSWLRGDAPGVMSTFIDDAVLLPPRGAAPIVGAKAMQDFWWPAGSPPTSVTKLNITVDELGGSAAVAYARGYDEVEWSTMQDGKTTTGRSKGTYLNVFRKGKDRHWRISHHMWDTE